MTLRTINICNRIFITAMILGALVACDGAESLNEHQENLSDHQTKHDDVLKPDDVKPADACSTATDEFVCNGDFEQPFNGYVSGNSPGWGMFGCGGEPDSNCYVPYWSGIETPDLMSSLFPGPTFLALPQGPVDSPNGGLSIARAIYASFFEEDLVTKLKQPLTPGQTYQISYDVIETNFPGVQMWGTTSQFDYNITDSKHCLELDVGMQRGSPGTYYKNCQDITQATVQVSSWTHVSYTYTADVAYQYLRSHGISHVINPAIAGGTGWINFLFDNFSVKQISTSQCSDGLDNDGDGLIDYPNDPGCSSTSDNDESNVIVASGCNIDTSSLSVPSSVAYSSVGNFSVSWNVPAGCNSMIEFNSGNYTLRYVPTTSSGTYTINYTQGVAQTESSIHVSLIAGNAASMKSITKDIFITQLPLPPAINQCEITSLTTTPVSLSGGNTTLTWTAPARCIVYVEKWTPGLHVDHVFNPGTYYFPNNGSVSVSVPVSEPTTFYVTAQTGSDVGTVLWAKTVDVLRQ